MGRKFNFVLSYLTRVLKNSYFLFSNRFFDRSIVLRAVSTALEATTIDPPLHHVAPQPWDHIQDKTRPGRCEAMLRLI